MAGLMCFWKKKGVGGKRGGEERKGKEGDGREGKGRWVVPLRL